MREKYESLSAVVLKDLAKARGIKGLTGMKKEDLVEAMLAQDEIDKAANAQKKEAAPTEEKKSRVYATGTASSGTYNTEREGTQPSVVREDNANLDSGQIADGILEVMGDGFGFIRCDNFLPGEDDIYVAPALIRRFGLKTGDILRGGIRVKNQGEKFAPLLYVSSVNGYKPEEVPKRPNFEDLTPIFPNERLHLERPGASVAMRVVDLVAPVGKGQRGMIVSQPKAGKTTLLKEIANSITQNNPEMHLIILLIDERPEEVTDIMESVKGTDVEVIHSTFDELPEHHRRVSEMVIERAKRLVEHKRDVIILLDSITRLARAYTQRYLP